MALIDEEIASQLRDELRSLENPVRLAVFWQASADPESEQVKRLVEELAGLNPRLTAESYDFALDQDAVNTLGIERIPSIAIMGAEKDYGIRLYGLPSGYEFGTLVDAIVDVSRAESGLAAETKASLATLAYAVRIKVFSTPSCPHCPRAVRLAYRFAIESDKVRADGVEVTGYPDLARRYSVSSVPKTVVNDRVEFVGAGPESLLLQHVHEAAAAGSASRR